jgi:hypothetical protein
MNFTETSLSRTTGGGRTEIQIAKAISTACSTIEIVAPVPILLCGTLLLLRTASNMNFF